MPVTAGRYAAVTSTLALVVALGGTGTCRHVLALVEGLVPASPSEHLVLAHAFNEHFAERQEPVRVASPWSTG